MKDIIVYPGNGVNSNSIVNKTDKWVIDPSGALPKMDFNGYTFLLTHVHPDHVNVCNVKGPLNVTGIGKDYILNPVKHADLMFRDKIGMYPGIFGSDLFRNGYKLVAGVEHLVHKSAYDSLDVKVLKDGDVTCGLTAIIVGGHTPDSSVFSFEDSYDTTGVGGDIVYRDRKSGSYKSRDASYKGVILGSNKLQKVGFDKMILGHGPEISGTYNISYMLESVINYEVNMGKAMLKMGLNGTDFRAIKKELGFEGRSDGGYGRVYAFAVFALENGLMEIKNKKLHTIDSSSDAVINALGI